MILDKVLRTIKERSMIRRGDRVLVAVSGGTDSTALLYVLSSLAPKLGVKLFVMHINHNLRGRDSDLDREFVRSSCAKLKIPFSSASVDVRGYAAGNKLGTEDAARRLRYTELEKAASRLKAARIALAHTSDDNVETFLMRLVRGSGPKGLFGIPAVRGKIVRPLIGTSRKEIEEYLRTIGVKARTDETNFDTKFFRNDIRHKLIPFLERYNPNIRGTILRTIETAARDHDLIENEAAGFVRSNVKSMSASAGIDTAKLLALHEAVRAEVVRQAILKVKKDLVDVTFINISDIVDALGKKRAEIDLSGATAYIEKGRLTISPGRREKVRTEEFVKKLTVPGSARVPGFVIRAKLRSALPKAQLMKSGPYRAYISAESVRLPLIVRNRVEGDVMSPLGMKGKKKLQDIFIDGKVDLADRAAVPIIEDGEKIAWVVGYRISEEVKVGPHSKTLIELTAERER